MDRALLEKRYKTAVGALATRRKRKAKKPVAAAAAPPAAPPPMTQEQMLQQLVAVNGDVDAFVQSLGMPPEVADAAKEFISTDPDQRNIAESCQKVLAMLKKKHEHE